MARDDRCVMTHRQGCVPSLLAALPRQCESGAMSRRPFPIDAVRRSVTRLMAETGAKPKPLAEKIGISPTGIRDIFLPKTKSVGGPKLAAIAKHFGVTVESIMAGAATTLVENSVESSSVVFAPIVLPNAPTLTVMFEALLHTAGIDDVDGEVAQALAEHFPNAFRSALLEAHSAVTPTHEMLPKLTGVSPEVQE